MGRLIKINNQILYDIIKHKSIQENNMNKRIRKHKRKVTLQFKKMKNLNCFLFKQNKLCYISSKDIQQFYKVNQFPTLEINLKDSKLLSLLSQ